MCRHPSVKRQQLMADDSRNYTTVWRTGHSNITLLPSQYSQSHGNNGYILQYNVLNFTFCFKWGGTKRNMNDFNLLIQSTLCDQLTKDRWFSWKVWLCGCFTVNDSNRIKCIVKTLYTSNLFFIIIFLLKSEIKYSNMNI